MCLIVFCKSNFFGHEIEPVLGLGLEGQVLGLDLQGQVLVNITVFTSYTVTFTATSRLLAMSTPVGRSPLQHPWIVPGVTVRSVLGVLANSCNVAGTLQRGIYTVRSIAKETAPHLPCFALRCVALPHIIHANSIHAANQSGTPCHGRSAFR